METDAFEAFVRATYVLEGDRVLCLETADTLQSLTAHVAMVRAGGAGTPNTRAVAREIVERHFGHELQLNKDNRVTELVDEQLAKVERSFNYFGKKMVELEPMVKIFTACRLFMPSRIAALGADTNDVEAQLTCFPFLDNDAVTTLMASLPAYMAYAAATPMVLDADGKAQVEQWWHDARLSPQMADWASAAKKILILQPSSAAAERVFSMLKAIMGEQQQNSALEDYQEAAIMTRYNALQRLNK